MHKVNRWTSERRRKFAFAPTAVITEATFYHLRRNFSVSIKFVSQHLEDDNICEKLYDH